jgi:hypothetical protein
VRRPAGFSGFVVGPPSGARPAPPPPPPRAEFDWSEVPYPERQQGMAEALPVTDSVMTDTAGVLCVPDPEQRHWFREVYVRKPGADDKPGRPAGFGKPGER